ncbi:hypothetical protein LDI01_27160 [Lentilactobacillus diolivorans]|uniref:Uncharacterized protein n=1 Tax=Lentilactobacillus diolivorans TaxID=179838 RepID=A0ABQ0XGD0_9LACO|nr:hypothetical protein LDI01_27160 [Lentilactobacillus diolivorans]
MSDHESYEFKVKMMIIGSPTTTFDELGEFNYVIINQGRILIPFWLSMSHLFSSAVNELSLKVMNFSLNIREELL